MGQLSIKRPATLELLDYIIRYMKHHCVQGASMRGPLAPRIREKFGCRSGTDRGDDY